MVEERQLSERRACSIVGLSRDSYRNPPQPDQLTRDLGERIVDIAHVHRRFGYRRIHDLLRSNMSQDLQIRLQYLEAIQMQFAQTTGQNLQVAPSWLGPLCMAFATF